MLGYEKDVFLKKNENTNFGPGKKGSLAAQTMFFTMNSLDFYTQKSALLGSILAPFGALMFPKPYYLQ